MLQAAAIRAEDRMKPKIRLLVTDLDNTRYDWVSFFATAFDAMVDARFDEILNSFDFVNDPRS